MEIIFAFQESMMIFNWRPAKVFPLGIKSKFFNFLISRWEITDDRKVHIKSDKDSCIGYELTDDGEDVIS